MPYHAMPCHAHGRKLSCPWLPVAECVLLPQVTIQRADPTIAAEADAALWHAAASSHRMAGAIHAAGTQVHSRFALQPGTIRDH